MVRQDLALRPVLRAAERLVEPLAITFYNDGEPPVLAAAVDRARIAAETVARAAGRGLPIGAGGSRVGA